MSRKCAYLAIVKVYAPLKEAGQGKTAAVSLALDSLIPEKTTGHFFS